MALIFLEVFDDRVMMHQFWLHASQLEEDDLMCLFVASTVLEYQFGEVMTKIVLNRSKNDKVGLKNIKFCYKFTPFSHLWALPFEEHD